MDLVIPVYMGSHHMRKQGRLMHVESQLGNITLELERRKEKYAILSGIWFLVTALAPPDRLSTWCCVFDTV